MIYETRPQRQSDITRNADGSITLQYWWEKLTGFEKVGFWEQNFVVKLDGVKTGREHNEFPFNFKFLQGAEKPVYEKVVSDKEVGDLYNLRVTLKPGGNGVYFFQRLPFGYLIDAKTLKLITKMEAIYIIQNQKH